MTYILYPFVGETREYATLEEALIAADIKCDFKHPCFKVLDLEDVIEVRRNWASVIQCYDYENVYEAFKVIEDKKNRDEKNKKAKENDNAPCI